MPKPCPSCSKPMELGDLSIGQTGLGFLFAGMALPHLFFHSPQDGKLSVLNWKSDDPPAWRCAACGTVVFLGKKDGG